MRACFSHAVRLFFLSFLQAFSALVSFWAFVSGFAVEVVVVVVPVSVGNAIAGVATRGGDAGGAIRVGNPGVVNVSASPWLVPSALVAVTR